VLSIVVARPELVQAAPMTGAPVHEQQGVLDLASVPMGRGRSSPAARPISRWVSS
jgi:hypothetical protein